MAESITEGTLKQWNKAVGDFVNQDEEIATIETDKVSPVLESFTSPSSSLPRVLFRVLPRSLPRVLRYESLG